MTESAPVNIRVRKTLQDPAVWILLVILVIALLTRTIDLGTRVMSHDEINHVYFAWLWHDGGRYQHNPVSHGPLQFHLLNLSYFLFGDNDVSARLPAALAGVVAVALIWPLRRWFKVRGALAAAVMLLFSPYMLYYSRYARNEIFVVVESLLTLWAIFRYLETKEDRWLYLLAAALALHATTKETYYIQTAQWLLYLASWLMFQFIRASWASERMKIWFGTGVAFSAFGFGLALFEFLQERSAAGEAAVPMTSSLVLIGAGIGALGLILAAASLIHSFGARLRTEFPLLDVLLVMITLTLPLLGALPAQALGWDPMAYSDTTSITRTTIIVISLVAVSLATGLLWDRRRWLIAAGIFILIYIPLYTTLFTNPYGLFSGLIGSLGYWLVQQGVERGSQPWFYYAFLQIPLYEFLPALGALMGSLFAIGNLRRKEQGTNEDPETQAGMRIQPMLVFYLIFSSLTTLLIYTYAGERMPWITVHLILPMILLSGWWFGTVFTGDSLRNFVSARGLGLLALGTIVFYALTRALRFISGLQPAASTVYQGVEQFTGWALPIVAALVAVLFMLKLASHFRAHQLLDFTALTILALLLLQTIRTAFRAAYENYDSAKEYLVYAHAASGPKLAMALVEELSLRTTGDYALPIGYDNDAAYPLWWYLRKYPQAFDFGAEPNRTVRDYPIVFASDTNAPRYEAYLGDAYQSMTFERLWWPREDYNNWTWQSVRDTLTNREMLRALWEIWLNRDYNRYAQLTGTDVTARGWQPAGRMKMYVRNDYAAGVLGLIETTEGEAWQDPYNERMIDLQPETILGGTGAAPGFFLGPRGLAIDTQGWIYVADSNNHRIQILNAAGELQQTWGFYADSSAGEAAAGGFNQPWDLSVASDGSVIVVDTWNHRIQRFTAQGELLNLFDTSQASLTPAGLYGPRGVAVDREDHVYIVDTGNKRILIYSLAGELLGSFGSGGLSIGNLDEPVGVAVDPLGRIWIADTWNQRIQVFEEWADGQFEALEVWPVEAWFGQSIENKPYLAISPQGHVCVTDPEGGRVLCFTSEGEFRLGFTGGGMILPSGIAFDESCRLWISDAGSDRLLRFNPELCQE
jgi:predicted membrane-bound mannosyltransferase/sugar lactone lactonase YvrE